MLPEINRLRNNKDIEWVFKKGRGLRADFVFLKLIKNKLGVIRFAFIVSQKISRKASSRNRIKRMLREAIRPLLPQAKAGLDVIIAAQGGAENKNFSEIQNSVQKLFKKAGII